MPFFDQVFSLRAAVIAIVLVPLLCIYGLGGFLVLQAVERRVESRMEEDIALIARTLRAPLSRSLERRRDVSLHRSLQSTSEIDRVYGVYVYDERGQLIAQADRADDRAGEANMLPSVDEDSRLGRVEYSAIDRDEGSGLGEYRSINGRELYSYYTPLTSSGGQAIGMLQVARRASDIRDYLAELRTNVGLSTAGFAGLFVATVLLAYHVVIGRPLNHLAETMSRVAVGRSGVRARESGPSELRKLARRFNAMLTGLAERDKALERERAEQLRLEHRLRQSEKYALVGRLAAGVAHELGTPLAVVDGHVQRLMRKEALGDAERAVLARVREQSGRMSAIVRRLLGFGTEASPGRRPVAVKRLVTLAAADVRAQLERTGARLEIFGGAAPDVEILADESRVREALVHLLRNAAHECGSGRVRIGWDQSAEAVRVFVENSGAPIPAEDRERIFEPFFSTKAPGEGSGLGLAIVKSTAADHGADVDVYESSLGGAGFALVFARDVSGGTHDER